MDPQSPLRAFTDDQKPLLKDITDDQKTLLKDITYDQKPLLKDITDEGKECESALNIRLLINSIDIPELMHCSRT